MALFLYGIKMRHGAHFHFTAARSRRALSLTAFGFSIDRNNAKADRHISRTAVPLFCDIVLGPLDADVPSGSLVDVSDGSSLTFNGDVTFREVESAANLLEVFGNAE